MSDHNRDRGRYMTVQSAAAKLQDLVNDLEIRGFTVAIENHRLTVIDERGRREAVITNG